MTEDVAVNVKKEEQFFSAGRRSEQCSHYENQCGASSKKPEIDEPQDPAMPHLVITISSLEMQPRNYSTVVCFNYAHTCFQMFLFKLSRY